MKRFQYLILFFLLNSLTAFGQLCNIDLVPLGFDCESRSWLFRFEIMGGEDFKVSSTVEVPLFTIGSNFTNVSNGDTLYVTFGDVAQVEFLSNPARLIFNRDYSNTSVALNIPAIDNGMCAEDFFDKRYEFDLGEILFPNPIPPLQACEVMDGLAEFELFRAGLDILGSQNGTVVFSEDSLFSSQILNDFYISGNDTIYAYIDDGICPSDFIPVILHVSPSDETIDISFYCGGMPCTSICDDSGLGQNASLVFTFQDPLGDYTVYLDERIGNEINSYILGSTNGQVIHSFLANNTAEFRIANIEKEGGSCVDLSTTISDLVLPYSIRPDYSFLDDTLVGCGTAFLPDLPSNVSLQTFFYADTFGSGTRYFPGTGISDSGYVYLYDRTNSCREMDSLHVVIESGSAAGADSIIAFCDKPDAVLILNEYLDSTAKNTSGSWWQDSGNGFVEVDNTFNPSMVSIDSATFYFISEPVVCRPDTAKITYYFNQELSAGQDNNVLLCNPIFGVNLTSLIEDKSIGGFWYDSINQKVIGDSEFYMEVGKTFVYFYIVNSAQCGTDTARLEVLLASDSFDDMDLEYCQGDLVPELERILSLTSLYKLEFRDEITWEIVNPDSMRNMDPGQHQIIFYRNFTNYCYWDTIHLDIEIHPNTLEQTIDISFPECALGDLNLEVLADDYTDLGAVVDQDTFWLSEVNNIVLIPGNQSEVSIISSNCQFGLEFPIERDNPPSTKITNSPNGGNGVVLNVSPSTNLTDIIWEGENLSCIECPSPILSESGEVLVHFLYNGMCRDTISGFVEILVEKIIYAPSIFSPDAKDERNSIFFLSSNVQADGPGVFMIMDRWGNKVFENSSYFPNEPSLGWNGKVNGNTVQQGVYLYFYEVSESGTQDIKTGTITVIGRND